MDRPRFLEGNVSATDPNSLSFMKLPPAKTDYEGCGDARPRARPCSHCDWGARRNGPVPGEMLGLDQVRVTGVEASPVRAARRL